VIEKIAVGAGGTLGTAMVREGDPDGLQHSANSTALTH